MILRYVDWKYSRFSLRWVPLGYSGLQPGWFKTATARSAESLLGSPKAENGSNRLSGAFLSAGAGVFILRMRLQHEGPAAQGGAEDDGEAA